jgi:sec-independent protein translocase protein TatB
MIDIGLTQIALVGVVALVVIGPEKLPTVARMAGSLYGRAQRYISQVKSEVGREIEMDELRKMQQEVKEAATQVEQTIAKNLSETEVSLKSDWDGGFETSAYDIESNPLISTPIPDQTSVKVKTFRRKRLARTSAIPSWYRNQQGRKSRVLSGAARVAKYRPASKGKPSGSFLG